MQARCPKITESFNSFFLQLSLRLTPPLSEPSHCIESAHRLIKGKKFGGG